MDYYQDESIGWMVIKDRARMNICCYPGTFLYWPNPPDVVGAITPVASEVISLLLVRILQCSFLFFLFFIFFLNNDNNNDSGGNNYLVKEFIQSVKWLGCLNRWLGFCRRRCLLTWMREKKMMMVQTIVYGYDYYYFFLLVVKSFGWPFCSTWTPEV